MHASSRTLYALTPRCHTWALNRSVLHFHLSHAVHFHTVIFVHTSLMNVNSNHPWGDALNVCSSGGPPSAIQGERRGCKVIHHFALPSGPTTAKLFERRCRIRSILEPPQRENTPPAAARLRVYSSSCALKTDASVLVVVVNAEFRKSTCSIF